MKIKDCLSLVAVYPNRKSATFFILGNYQHSKEKEKFFIQLVITEKPSVAQSIAHVIGTDERKDGYMEGNGYIVSWCIGHPSVLQTYFLWMPVCIRKMNTCF